MFLCRQIAIRGLKAASMKDCNIIGIKKNLRHNTPFWAVVYKAWVSVVLEFEICLVRIFHRVGFPKSPN